MQGITEFLYDTPSMKKPTDTLSYLRIYQPVSLSAHVNYYNFIENGRMKQSALFILHI